MFMKTVKSTERTQQRQVEKFINEYLVEYYPKSIKWYCEKVVPNIEQRYIVNIVSYDENFLNILGLLILKPSEKKICTIYVKDGYRQNGVGTQLMLTAFELLETDKPFITFPNRIANQFKSVLEAYGWELRGMYPNLYKSGSIELVYNGNLY